MVHEPSGIPVDKTTVTRTQARLGKPDAVPLDAEEVALDVLYLVAELLLNTCRIFDDHTDLREYGKKGENKRLVTPQKKRKNRPSVEVEREF
jgi:hypothetical protein